MQLEIAVQRDGRAAFDGQSIFAGTSGARGSPVEGDGRLGASPDHQRPAVSGAGRAEHLICERPPESRWHPAG
jgi:hypothetical protein